MTRRKPTPARDNIKYKQTDISLYFKARRKLDVNTKPCSTTEKENSSEEFIVKRRPPVKPLPSDDEADMKPHSQKSALEPLAPALLCNNGPEEQMPVEIPILRECQLPYTLPMYGNSQDSDETYCSGIQLTPPKNILRNVKLAKKMFESAASTSQSALTTKNNSDCITQNSDDDDFEATPIKIVKVNESYCKPSPGASSPRKRSKARRKLYQSNKDASREQHQNDLPSTSRGIYRSGTPPRVAADVNQLTGIITSKGISMPPTAQQKRSHDQSSNSSTPSSSQEFVSTDFISSTVIQEVSTNSSNPGSNPILAPNKNINDVRSNKITILGDVQLSPSVSKIQTSTKQCNLSSDKPASAPTKNSNLTKNVNVKDTKNVSVKKTKNVTKTNSSSTSTKAEQDWYPHASKLVRKIVKFICSHSHLKTMLTGQETDMLNNFFQMPEEKYISVCITLFIKKQDWNNIFQLVEMLNMNMGGREVKTMYEYLSQNGFVDTDYSSEPFEYFLNCLRRTDIKNICDDLKIKLETSRKADMISKLLLFCRSTSPPVRNTEQLMLRHAIKDRMGLCVKINSNFFNVLNKVHLLYSLVNEFETIQDMYLFMTRIDKKEEFLPTFPIAQDFQLFSSMAEFSSFVDAYECKRAVQDACNNKKIAQVFHLCKVVYVELQKNLKLVPDVRRTYLRHFTAGYNYTKALSLGATFELVAKLDPNEAQEWLKFLLAQRQFCQEMRGSWYESLVKIQYYFLKKYDDAVATLIEALESGSLSRVAIYKLRDRAEEIKEKKGHNIKKIQKDNISCVEPKPIDEFRSIEICRQANRSHKKESKGKDSKKSDTKESVLSIHDEALEYYQKSFANWLHCENSLLITIFFVLFWDVIYESSVPAAFVSEIQYFPLDLLTEDFYTNREEAINARIHDIRYKWPSSQLELFVSNIWEKHAHEKSYISDELVDEPKQLCDIILCIGRVKLAQILEHIAKDFNIYQFGIPNLFFWNVSQKKCKFVQVREEKEKLSVEQALWMDFLRSVGADVEVCVVQNGGSIPTVKREKIKGAKKEEQKCLNKSKLVKSFIFS